MSKKNFPYIFKGDRLGVWAKYNNLPCKRVQGRAAKKCRLIEFPDGRKLYIVPEAIRLKKSAGT